VELLVVMLLEFLLAYELAAALLLIFLTLLEFSLFEEEATYDEVISFGLEALDEVLLVSFRYTDVKVLN